MALVNFETDQWTVEYEACENLSREIMSQMHARERERPGSYSYDSISGRVRSRLRQLTNDTNELRKKLQLQPLVSSLVDEKERRVRQIENLESRLVQVQKQFEQSGAGCSRDIIKKTGWIDDDDDELIDINKEVMRNAPISDIRSQQTQMLEEQEEGLGQLSQVIARQKQIAIAITDEVDEQAALLDGIGNTMDNVNVRMRGETDMIKTITRKDSTCAYWIVILLLLIAIIGIIVAPGR